MQHDWATPTPLQYFAVLVQSDDDLPLLEAAASLAQDDWPELDVQQVLADVDQLAARLQRRVDRQAPVLDRLGALGQFFFGELGFAGNANDYYAVENSYLHRVLHTRRGIPISLAVLWLELARSLDLTVEGVSFPGHFLVQAHLDEGRVVIDPFTGQSLSQAELRERLDEWTRPASGPGFAQELPLTLFLEGATPRQILARMLGNLKHIHHGAQDWQRAVAVQDRLITLLPRAWDEYRERGLALAELGELQRARVDLAVYLRQAGQAPDRDHIAERLRALGGDLI
ncbi:MAG: tetratricopeptide repeat protein [Burkholderiaceae bacterium]|jgi:regulator of sirC expression with transglutaminase-like and TPR domain|nr:tetratricopeptide repeat protein [Pseudomonadota bacterium]MCO5117578.1 tetratricopeptide repeat protein [Burkholderiaceae bacterium]MCP5218258.1 tetratricopeptide repeat protein [Burkholderiaceae bacterium]